MKLFVLDEKIRSTITPCRSYVYRWIDNPATISTIAKPGAMLNHGQKRAKENAALAAEPCSAAECTPGRPGSRVCTAVELIPGRGVLRLSTTTAVTAQPAQAESRQLGLQIIEASAV